MSTKQTRAQRRPAQTTAMCTCGHPREAHEHFRRGTECSICDIRACSAFAAVAQEEHTPSR